MGLVYCTLRVQGVERWIQIGTSIHLRPRPPRLALALKLPLGSKGFWGLIGGLEVLNSPHDLESIPQRTASSMISKGYRLGFKSKFSANLKLTSLWYRMGV